MDTHPTVLDDGNAVASLSTHTGAAPRTGAFYLPAGVYTIVYSVQSTSGSYSPATYWVSGEILSDPISAKMLRVILPEIQMLELTAGYWTRAGQSRLVLKRKGLKARIADALIAQDGGGGTVR